MSLQSILMQLAPILPINLGVICYGNSMYNPILLNQIYHVLVEKMAPLVTNDVLRHTIPTKYIRPHKILNLSSIISLCGLSIHPLGDII